MQAANGSAYCVSTPVTVRFARHTTAKRGDLFRGFRLAPFGTVVATQPDAPPVGTEIVSGLEIIQRVLKVTDHTREQVARRYRLHQEIISTVYGVGYKFSASAE